MAYFGVVYVLLLLSRPILRTFLFTFSYKMGMAELTLIYLLKVGYCLKNVIGFCNTRSLIILG